MNETMPGAAHAPKPVIERGADTTAPTDAAAAAEESEKLGVGMGDKHVKDKRAKGTGSHVSGAAPAPSRFQDATVGLFQGFGFAAWSYANAHPHTVLYGLIGFVLAVLILVIGLWDTIVIAVFVIVGAVIGQMVDGDNAIVNFFSRLFGGRR